MTPASPGPALTLTPGGQPPRPVKGLRATPRPTRDVLPACTVEPDGPEDGPPPPPSGPAVATEAYTTRRVVARSEPSWTRGADAQGFVQVTIDQGIDVKDGRIISCGGATLDIDCPLLTYTGRHKLGVSFEVDGAELGHALDMLIAALTAAKASAIRHGVLPGGEVTA